MADPHRGHQHVAASDEDAVFDDGGIFLYAVVIAGDCSGTDVGVRAQGGVAEIRQVKCLGAPAQARFLHFHEVANARRLLDHRAISEVRKGADSDAGSNLGVGNHRAGPHCDAVGEP